MDRSGNSGERPPSVMPLYDVSTALRKGMSLYPGDPPFTSELQSSIEKGDLFNVTWLSLGTHTGTHVDAPAHRIHGGSTVDQIPLEIMVGPAEVLDMRGLTEIDRVALEAAHLSGFTRVLFKTDNSPMLRGGSSLEKWVHLTQDAASYLVDMGVRLVGIDYLSVECANSKDYPVHRVLLQAGILVVEGIDLLDVPAGPCELYCLPLKILGADGAPARVLIRTD